MGGELPVVLWDWDGGHGGHGTGWDGMGGEVVRLVS